MKALTIKQPYSSLVAAGIKDIENRTWPTKYRGRVYLHSSAPTRFNVKLSDEQIKAALPVLISAFDGSMPFGAIIGEVDIVDCVLNHRSIWAIHRETKVKLVHGKKIEIEVPLWNWVLANPLKYDTPIYNVKGKLSFWEYYPNNQ